MLFSFIAASILLLIGGVSRAYLPWLRRFYIPASVVGGLVGLAVALGLRLAVGDWQPADDILSELRSWPGFLIALVFGGMLMVPGDSGASVRLSGAAREGVMVWIIGLGQTATGCLLVWLVLSPIFSAPPQLAILIETGFVGGHGTAASMGSVLASDSIGIDDGLALGTLVATIGLIYGIVSGVAWVNLGVRRKWIATGISPPADSNTAATSRSKPVSENLPNENSADKKSGDEIDAAFDPFLLQAIYLAIALLIGMLLQALMRWVAISTGTAAVLGDLPLFIYTLAGGWLVGRGAQWVGGGSSIRGDIVSRIIAMVMDVLVVAAIASLDLIGVIDDLPVVVILCLGGAVWTAVCLLVLAKRILPSEHWFELGLLNYGMSTGTTATGFVLLRMVDPDLRTGAAKDYALATPLSSPFIGGGMLTFAMPMLALGRVPIAWMTILLWVIISVLIAIAVRKQSPTSTPE